MGHHRVAPEDSNRVTVEKPNQIASNGASRRTRLDLNWENLDNVKYLDRGGFSYIYKAELNDKPVVVKKLKPKFRVRRFAINGMEDEVGKCVLYRFILGLHRARIIFAHR